MNIWIVKAVIIFGITLGLFIPVLSHAQNDSGAYDGTTSASKNHFVTFQIGYNNSCIGKTVGANGFLSTIGFNPAKFFSEKVVAGIVCDIKLFPGLMRVNIPNNLRNDLNANFYVPANQFDSVNAMVVHSSLNGNGIHGNYQFYYGLMFSLLPHKAGGIMIQVKRGTEGFELRDNVFGNPFIDGGGYDKYPFAISGNMKYQITIKPYSLFYDSYIDVHQYVAVDFLKAFSISIYYEKINFRNAEFYGTKFSQFLRPGFMNKYGTDNRFGFVLGFSLY